MEVKNLVKGNNIEFESTEEIIQANSQYLGHICSMLDRVADSEMTWNKERAAFIINLRNQLADVLDNNYGQLLEDSKTMTEYAESLSNERKTGSR